MAIEDSNLVYGTWILVIATIIGIIFTTIYTRCSLKETKRSNEMLETELKIHLRPLFQLVNTKSSLQGKSDDFKVRLYYTIKNLGTVHARKITIRAFESNNTEIDHIIREWDTIKNSYLPLGTIQIGGELSRFDDIKWQNDKQTTNWIIWIEYEYFDIKEKCIIVFPNLGGGQEPVSHRWFVHEDVIEAEQNWIDTKSGKTGL